MLDQNYEEQKMLQVNAASEAYLLETARWGKFIGIVYSIILSFLVLFFPVMIKMSSAQYEQMGMPAGTISTVFFLVFLVIIGINFYPLYALIRSSVLVKRGIKNKDQEQFDKGLRFQKNLYKYLGILTMIVLFIYGIEIIFILIVSLFSNI
jgi:hypothetical protein